MRRCYGRTKNLTRCSREGQWKLFCHELWLFGLIFTVMAGTVSILSYFAPQPTLNTQEDKGSGQKLGRLTAEQQAQFISRLKVQQQSRKEIRLGCAVFSEEACVLCVLAGQLLKVFREEGWVVQGNKVERVTLPKPLAGVALFKHGEGQLDPSNPKSGLWVEQTASLVTLRASFAKIGMEADTRADAQMPKGTIGVFIGPNL
jgi:hypothetical protein